MDRLAALRAFTYVAEYSSFSEAARRLRWSPAAVTRAVALLEGTLGIVLFSRTTRSVKLTDRGALYLESARQLLSDFEEAERRIRGDAALPRGRLTVAAPIMFGRMHVLPIVERMLRAYPDLEIDFRLSDRLIHLVEEGVDVAVRVGKLSDSAMMAVKVGEVRRVTVASPDYLAGRPAIAAPEDLDGHDLISFDSIDATDEWRFQERPAVRIKPRLRVNTAEAAIAAAVNGLGITQTLSYQVAEPLASGRLRLILEDCALPPVPVNMLHAGQRIRSTSVTEFLRLARDSLRGQHFALRQPETVTT